MFSETDYIVERHSPLTGSTDFFLVLFICKLSILLPLKDKNLMSLTGKVLMTCDLARRYGLQDIDGKFRAALCMEGFFGTILDLNQLLRTVL